MNNAQRRIRILDSTLREGMQHPGVNLNHGQMATIVKRLEGIGVDQIEIHGNVSRHHYEFARQILCRQSNFNADIVVHCRALQRDIDDAINIGARSIGTYIGTSPAHLHRLGITLDEAINVAVRVTGYARGRGVSVRVTMEDATSTSPADLLRICMAVQNAGATSISIPDTRGMMNPRTMGEHISYLRNHGITLQLDTHCHNDLDQAVANSFAAVLSGANQIHTTINGVGERCGIASLSSIAAAASNSYHQDGLNISIRTEQLTELSRDFYHMIHRVPPSTQPVVGRNAFSNTAGTHIHGITSSSATYLGLSAEMVGNRISLVYGVLTGRRAVEFLLYFLELRSQVTHSNLWGVNPIDLENMSVSELVDLLKGQSRNDLFTVTMSEAEFNSYVSAFRAREEAHDIEPIAT